MRRGQRGKERARRGLNGQVVGFGEEVWYMKPGIVWVRKVEHQVERRDMVRYKRERTSDAIIRTEEGCIKRRSVKRKPVGSRWSGVMWKTMKEIPWEPVRGRPGSEFKRQVAIKSGEPARVLQASNAEKHVRRVYIAKRDVMDGPTPGCEGCSAVMWGSDNCRRLNEECRSQITRLMEEGEVDEAMRASERMMYKEMEEKERQEEDRSE